MKKFFRYIFVGVMALTATSCNDFLSEDPKRVIDQDRAFSRCDAMVTSAYAMLGDCWYSYPFNLWPYGDLLERWLGNNRHRLPRNGDLVYAHLYSRRV